MMVMMMMMRCLSWMRFRGKPRHLPYMYICKCMYIYIYLNSYTYALTCINKYIHRGLPHPMASWHPPSLRRSQRPAPWWRSDCTSSPSRWGNETAKSHGFLIILWWFLHLYDDFPNFYDDFPMNIVWVEKEVFKPMVINHIMIILSFFPL
jgi:hypothetical protein